MSDCTHLPHALSSSALAEAGHDDEPCDRQRNVPRGYVGKGSHAGEDDLGLHEAVEVEVAHVGRTRRRRERSRRGQQSVGPSGYELLE